MNIYALFGHKVRLISYSNGYQDEQITVRKHLKMNEEYTIEKTEVNSFNTRVWLQEVPHIAFNSVFFEDVVPQSKEQDQLHPDYKRYNL